MRDRIQQAALYNTNLDLMLAYKMSHGNEHALISRLK